jgi:hypothetical protein
MFGHPRTQVRLRSLLPLRTGCFGKQVTRLFAGTTVTECGDGAVAMQAAIRTFRVR